MAARKSARARAIEAIDRRGILLVYPIKNRPLPLSLWSELHPRTRMVWDWNEDSDDKIADLWHLREQLSRSRVVVYSKWYQNRATFFSREVFVAMLAYLGSCRREFMSESGMALEALEANSPMSTKELKAAVELEGRLLEPTYNRALKPLWQTLQLVGFGEFEDSSFPSLGVGATRTLFEDLWEEASQLSSEDAESFLLKKLGEDNLFLKFAGKVLKNYPI